jgi:hypothetical protein
MFTPPDKEGWMWCNAIINSPGFRGDVDFQMLRSDLDTFHAQLSNSLESASWPCKVRLASTDPGIDLTLHVERTGQVVGNYQFGGRGAYRPVLSGAFAMDQTYLRPLLTQVEQLIADLAGE